MSFQSAIEAAESVISKQNAASAKTDSALQRIIRSVEAAKALLESGEHAEPESVMSDLNKTIQDDLKTTVGQTKEIHSAVGKLGKVCNTLVAL